MKQLLGARRKMSRLVDTVPTVAVDRRCSCNVTDIIQELHLQTVTEVLQSIKASEMTPMLQRIFNSEGGADILDVLMKYLYKGMSTIGNSSTSRSSNVTPQATGFSQVGVRPGAGGENTGSQMSVLLSWHEKVVDVAGLGCIARVMSDRRRV